MSGLVWRAVLIAAAVAAVAFPLGYFTQHWVGWTLFCLGLVGQIAYGFRNFARLEVWSRQPVVDDSLEGEGAWDDIFGRLYRHEREMREQITARDRQIAMLIAAGQALNDGVVLLDHQGNIQFCNAMAEGQFGLDVNVDRGHPIVNLVRQPEFVAYLNGTDFSRPLIMGAGRQTEWVLSVYVIPYAENRRLLQIKDVTKADRLDRMRRDFVANVSHELRTPLTVLAGFLETLREVEFTQEEQHRYLDLMAEQSRRMQSIVQDLLTLSSIESAPPPESTPIDMAGLIDKLRRDAEALSDGRHTIEVDADPHLDLLGAENELVSAFGNLVANAVRYTPAGGSVRISWRSTQTGAEFAVQDTGIGIEAVHLPRLTERFYRVDRGRSRDAGGTGLGLAIVKHSLNRHQSDLQITSIPGQGSRFAAKFQRGRLVTV